MELINISGVSLGTNFSHISANSHNVFIVTFKIFMEVIMFGFVPDF